MHKRASLRHATITCVLTLTALTGVPAVASAAPGDITVREAAELAGNSSVLSCANSVVHAGDLTNNLLGQTSLDGVADMIGTGVAPVAISTIVDPATSVYEVCGNSIPVACADNSLNNGLVNVLGVSCVPISTLADRANQAR